MTEVKSHIARLGCGEGKCNTLFEKCVNIIQTSRTVMAVIENITSSCNFDETGL
jgi:hypothetical protein